MARVRLTAPGMEHYTGKIAKVSFVDGVSADISPVLAASVGAVTKADMVDDDGETVLGSANPAATVAANAAVREEPRPTGINTTSPMRLDAEPLYIKTIDALEYTLAPADYGYLLDFTSGAEITVPVNLNADFYCTMRQGGEDQIEVLSDGAAVIEEIDDHYKSEKRLAILALARFPNGSYQLSGRTSA